jgi:hypothetical protein
MLAAGYGGGAEDSKLLNNSSAPVSCSTLVNIEHNQLTACISYRSTMRKGILRFTDSFLSVAIGKCGMSGHSNPASAAVMSLHTSYHSTTQWHADNVGMAHCASAHDV